MEHPILGLCYNIDGLCEEDKCTCWEDPENLHAKIEEIRARFPFWEEVANLKQEADALGLPYSYWFNRPIRTKPEID